MLPVLNENAPDVFMDAIPKIKCPFVVSDGTALGLYREGDFIKGDSDIDIAIIFYKGVDQDVKEWLHGYECFREIWKDGKLSQLAFLKDGVIFDTYYHYKKGKNYTNKNEENQMTIMPCYLYDKPTLFKTKYGVVPMPSDIEEYLVRRYGDDWMIPSKKKVTFQ